MAAMRSGGGLTDERVDALIGKIYDAAGDTDQWSGAIGALCHAMGAQSGVIWFRDLASGCVPLFLTYNQDPCTPALYAEYFHRQDVWFSACEGLRVGGAFGGEELVPWDDLTRTEFYNDFLKPFALDRIASTRLVNSACWMSHCSVFRPARRDSFDPASMKLFRMLSPHLRRAVDLHLKLAAVSRDHRLAQAALDALAIGVVITDRAGHILFANDSARTILKRNDGLSFGTLGLRCGRSDDTAELRKKIHAATTLNRAQLHATCLNMTVARPSGSTYLVAIAPLRGVSLDILGGRGAAIVFVRDPEQVPEAPSELLERTYGLTPAETRLAVAVGAGKTLDDLASAFNVGKATLRTQLQQIFSKTGTSRQAELVLLIARHQSLLKTSQGY
jgi:DNA-binding CsgD family transcriptional regulator